MTYHISCFKIINLLLNFYLYNELVINWQILFYFGMDIYNTSDHTHIIIIITSLNAHLPGAAIFK